MCVYYNNSYFPLANDGIFYTLFFYLWEECLAFTNKNGMIYRILLLKCGGGGQRSQQPEGQGSFIVWLRPIHVILERERWEQRKNRLIV